MRKPGASYRHTRCELVNTMSVRPAAVEQGMLILRVLCNRRQIYREQIYVICKRSFVGELCYIGMGKQRFAALVNACSLHVS
jgi:hypothetical protein